MKKLFALVALSAAACAHPAPIVPLTLPFPTDTLTDRRIADGVVYRYVKSPKGPWGIHVLDVDMTRCYSAVAVKGAPGAVGRKKVSAMLEELRAKREVIGGVNADFFTLTGFQGMPTGALIMGSKVIVGPGQQPVVAIDGRGVPTIGTFRSASSIGTHGVQQPIPNWNRPGPGGLAVYDANWGAALDTATGVIEVTVDGKSPSTVRSVDTTIAGAAIPATGYVLIAGKNAPARQRDLLMNLRPGDRVDVHLALAPFQPVEAVGGRPMLTRDSAVVDEVDTEGQESFRGRNPRTALGISNNGHRMLLVVIDGRQKPYSDGTTLRETAEIMLALGARDAINLDGGGSSALAYLGTDTKRIVVANHPSDVTGERPVGDALAIVKGCR
jgi:hypothetical protein